MMALSPCKQHEIEAKTEENSKSRNQQTMTTTSAAKNSRDSRSTIERTNARWPNAGVSIETMQQVCAKEMWKVFRRLRIFTLHAHPIEGSSRGPMHLITFQIAPTILRRQETGGHGAEYGCCSKPVRSILIAHPIVMLVLTGEKSD